MTDEGLKDLPSEASSWDSSSWYSRFTIRSTWLTRQQGLGLRVYLKKHIAWMTVLLSKVERACKKPDKDPHEQACSAYSMLQLVDPFWRVAEDLQKPKLPFVRGS